MNDCKVIVEKSEMVTGVILQAVTPGWWIIKDDSGHKHRVASPDLWRKGDRVAVVGGQILGHAVIKKEETKCLV